MSSVLIRMMLGRAAAWGASCAWTVPARPSATGWPASIPAPTRIAITTPAARRRRSLPITGDIMYGPVPLS